MDIKQLSEQFKNELELQQFAIAQQRIIEKMAKEVKQLQEEIEAIKNALDASIQMAPADKKALKELYQQLGEMQERTTTQDYQKALNTQLNIDGCGYQAICQVAK